MRETRTLENRSVTRDRSPSRLLYIPRARQFLKLRTGIKWQSTDSIIAYNLGARTRYSVQLMFRIYVLLLEYDQYHPLV
jgi:hypothetical protein